METRRVPLFPLNVVLFPGMLLPLHIFEPRYQEMIRTCLAGDQRFGVALIRSGQEVGGPAETCSVGTLCEILSVTPLAGGRMELLTVGRERFELIRRVDERAYPEAEIALLPPDQPGNPGPLAATLRVEAEQYLRELLASAGDEIAVPPLPDDPEELSFLVGSLVPAPLTAHQQLLETRVTEERLRRLLALMRPAARPLVPDPGTISQN